MTHAPDPPDDAPKPPHPALLAWRGELALACALGPVLDVACGSGQNGLYAAGLGCRVEFVDRNPDLLRAIPGHALRMGIPAQRLLLSARDLETGPADLGRAVYGAILVFHYLHRPLFPAIARALLPGGLLIYETYTRDQAALGRPRNPDFLLAPGELRQAFAALTELAFFEGEASSPRRFVSRLVARKPG